MSSTKRLALAAAAVALLSGVVAAVAFWPSAPAPSPAVSVTAPRTFASFIRPSSVSSGTKSHLGFLDSSRFLGDSFLPTASFVQPAPPNGVTVPLDGTSSIYRPTAENQWAVMGWPVPSYRFQLQEASGSITDDVHGITAAASGAGHTYQASGSEATYASKGIRLVDGTASMGFTSAAGALWDPTYQSLCVYVEFENMTTPAATRAIVALTGAASAYVGMTASPASALRLQGGTAVNGTINYHDAKRHPLIAVWRPGTVTGGQILGHTSSQYRISTDKEQFSATWTSVADSTKGIGTGGSASLTSSDTIYFEFDAWVGSSCDTIVDSTTEKVFLQRKGWTVTGYRRRRRRVRLRRYHRRGRPPRFPMLMAA